MDRKSSAKVLETETIDATIYENGYVFVYWKTNKLGHLPKSLIRGLKTLEDFIKTFKLNGWYCNSEEGHKDMHKIIERCGGVRCGDKDGFVWFKKDFVKEKKNV